MFFVWKSTYNRLRRELQESREECERSRMENMLLSCRFHDLQIRWADVVKRINAKGGEAFLKYGKMYDAPQATQTLPLTRDELTRIISLCHPDKHGGARAMNDLTAKLLALRKRMP